MAPIGMVLVSILGLIAFCLAYFYAKYSLLTAFLIYSATGLVAYGTIIWLAATRSGLHQENAHSVDAMSKKNLRNCAITSIKPETEFSCSNQSTAVRAKRGFKVT